MKKVMALGPLHQLAGETKKNNKSLSLSLKLTDRDRNGRLGSLFLFALGSWSRRKW